MTLLYWFCAGALIALGLAGLVFPALPGAPLLFLGLFVAAWIEKFVYIGAPTLAVLGALALLTYGVDLWAAMFGTRRFGASRRAVLGAVIGSIAGIFFGVPGVIFGPFIGAVFGELLAQRGLQQAARAGVGASVGVVLGVALKLALAFGMIGVFVFARLF